MTTTGQTFKGTLRPDVRVRRLCERCGRDLYYQNTSRRRRDGLKLCTDCTDDKWLIKEWRKQKKVRQ